MEHIKILSNIGSASKKYSVYGDDFEIAWFHYEKVGNEFLCSYKIHSGFEKKHISAAVYDDAIIDVFELLKNAKTVNDRSDISAIALRVVVPHAEFILDTKCVPEIIEKLKHLEQIDPIHISLVLNEIGDIQNFFTLETPLYLISDSGFHASGKKKIPLAFAQPMHTIGYHGLSCESVLTVLKDNEINHSKLIIAHLGGGSSVSAIQNGISLYNSMEVSPLSGVLMSTRSGSIDPFAVLLYMKEHSLSYEEALRHLYEYSGLKALSGVSGDLRVVREEAFKGNKDAKSAILQFVDSIATNIAKAAAFTQGLDTLVFTGTIGLRATYIREMVLERMLWLGCVTDHYKNTDQGNSCFEISAHDSKVKIFVVQIDEMKEMHRHLQKIIQSRV